MGRHRPARARGVDGGAVGDLVDLFLKPERIRITAAGSELGEGALNRLEGVLRDVIFKGPYVDCLVALGTSAS